MLCFDSLPLFTYTCGLLCSLNKFEPDRFKFIFDGGQFPF